MCVSYRNSEVGVARSGRDSPLRRAQQATGQVLGNKGPAPLLPVDWKACTFGLAGKTALAMWGPHFCPFR